MPRLWGSWYLPRTLPRHPLRWRWAAHFLAYLRPASPVLEGFSRHNRVHGHATPCLNIPPGWPFPTGVHGTSVSRAPAGRSPDTFRKASNSSCARTWPRASVCCPTLDGPAGLTRTASAGCNCGAPPPLPSQQSPGCPGPAPSPCPPSASPRHAPCHLAWPSPLAGAWTLRCHGAMPRVRHVRGRLRHAGCGAAIGGMSSPRGRGHGPQELHPAVRSVRVPPGPLWCNTTIADIPVHAHTGALRHGPAPHGIPIPIPPHNVVLLLQTQTSDVSWDGAITCSAGEGRRATPRPPSPSTHKAAYLGFGSWPLSLSGSTRGCNCRWRSASLRMWRRWGTRQS